MKKKPNYFFKILTILFIIYVALYISLETGYYESKIAKTTIITEEKIQQFEEDVKEGKDIDIKDYITNNYVDYSSPMSKVGLGFAHGIEKFMDGGMSDIFKTIANLFT